MVRSARPAVLAMKRIVSPRSRPRRISAAQSWTRPLNSIAGWHDTWRGCVSASPAAPLFPGHDQRGWRRRPEAFHQCLVVAGGDLLGDLLAVRVHFVRFGDEDDRTLTAPQIVERRGRAVLPL